MIRGTTPSIAVRTPLEKDTMADVILVVKQDKDIIAEKHMKDALTFGGDPNLFIFSFTEEETLSMVAKGGYSRVRMQATIHYKDGSIDKTHVKLVPVDDILKEPYEEIEED